MKDDTVNRRQEAVSRLWRHSDDAVSKMMKLSEIYSNVPSELDVDVWVDEFHTFECTPEMKKKVLNWLNRPKD